MIILKAVHFGAGNIGRGFIGQILSQNGFDITFLDNNRAIIDQINTNNGYSIQYLDRQKSTFWVKNVSAIDSGQHPRSSLEALVAADLITTSVGVNNLKKIAPLLKEALVHRAQKQKSVNILANENMINASTYLKKYVYQLASLEEQNLLHQYATFVNTAIDRQALSFHHNDQIIAAVEPYYEWVIDSSVVQTGAPLPQNNVVLVDNIQPYIERKLYIVNASHAALAYVGYLLGYSTIQQAMHNPQIDQLVRSFITTNLQYFVQQYQQSLPQLQQFAAQTMQRHQNPQLTDPVTRVGRAPIRKLQKNDRLVGPFLRTQQLQLPNPGGQRIIASAYLYNNPDDPEAVLLQKKIAAQGYQATIQEVSQLSATAAHQIALLCQRYYQDPQQILDLREVNNDC